MLRLYIHLFLLGYVLIIVTSNETFRSHTSSRAHQRKNHIATIEQYPLSSKNIPSSQRDAPVLYYRKHLSSPVSNNGRNYVLHKNRVIMSDQPVPSSSMNHKRIYYSNQTGGSMSPFYTRNGNHHHITIPVPRNSYTKITIPLNNLRPPAHIRHSSSQSSRYPQIVHPAQSLRYPISSRSNSQQVYSTQPLRPPVIMHPPTRHIQPHSSVKYPYHETVIHPAPSQQQHHLLIRIGRYPSLPSTDKPMRNSYYPNSGYPRSFPNNNPHRDDYNDRHSSNRNHFNPQNGNRYPSAYKPAAPSTRRTVILSTHSPPKTYDDWRSSLGTSAFERRPATDQNLKFRPQNGNPHIYVNKTNSSNSLNIGIGVSRNGNRRNDPRQIQNTRKNTVVHLQIDRQQRNGVNNSRNHVNHIPPLGVDHYDPSRKTSKFPSLPHNCIRCPSDQILIIDKGKDCTTVTVPPLKACSRLTKRPGKMDVLLGIGPKPGNPVKEGGYIMQFHIIKAGAKIKTCQFRINVKALRCSVVQAPVNGMVQCTNKRMWGSVCHFICDQGYRLVGSSTTVCDGNKKHVGWTSPAPLCERLEDSSLHRPHCKKPAAPEHGLVYCNPEGQHELYAGSACFYSCFAGYEIPSRLIPYSYIICLGHEWNITKNVMCQPLQQCSKPSEPKHGYVKCIQAPLLGEQTVDSLNYFIGTKCYYNCDRNYAIPNNQLNMVAIECLESGWNHTNIPKCLPLQCPKPNKPKHGKVKCIQAPLLGEPKDTANANSVNYFIGTKCYYNCDINYEIPTDQLNLVAIECVGSVWNHTGVPKCLPLQCPKPNIPEHGDVTCVDKSSLKWRGRGDVPVNNQVNNQITYFNGTVCYYSCNSDYVIPTSQSDKAIIECTVPFWNSSDVVKCQEKISPNSHPDDCQNQTFVVKEGIIKIKPPRFFAADNSPLTANCSLDEELTPGLHENYCKVTDPELKTSAACSYTVNVTAIKCDPLPTIDYGEIICTSEDYTVTTVCQYDCRNGYVIPTSMRNISTRICLSSAEWNITSIPECKEQVLPSSHVDDCQNQTFTAQEEAVPIKLPRFFAADGKPLTPNCSVNGDLKPGLYENYCEVTDPELKTSTSCSYMININAVECDAPPKIDYGSVICSSEDSPTYPVATDCHYSCQNGYVIPTSVENVNSRTCLSSAEWNVTDVPECKKRVVPKPQDGACDDKEIKTDDPNSIILKEPIFLTSDGKHAEVSCQLTSISNHGTYENNCEAKDLELRTSASCKYNIIVKDAGETDSMQEHVCGPIKAPTNGQIKCRRQDQIYNCTVRCNEGFNFPTFFTNRGYVICDTNEGFWDFEEEFNLNNLPDCLGQLPNTVFQSSIKFKVNVENCSDYAAMDRVLTAIKQNLISKMGTYCDNVDCTGITSICSVDREKGTSTVEITWVLESSYNVDDYANNNEIPDAEKYIQQIQVEFSEIVVKDNQFKEEISKAGGNLQQNSFEQSKIILTCPKEGYILDYDTDKCFECPTGTFEEEGKCEVCPGNYYQDKTGETRCIPCPRETISNPGSRSKSDCTDYNAGLVLPGTVRDRPLMESAVITNCDSHPCKNGGTCILTLNSFTCVCRDNYTGSKCETLACPENYCLNGSTCVSLFNNVIGCKCSKSFTGSRCESRIAESSLPQVT